MLPKYKVRFYWWILIWIIFCFILLAKCEYDNKTYGINETYIPMGCKERCVCDVINGTASPNCSYLCITPIDPVCKANTQQVEVYQQPLKGTNCSCPAKRCIAGLKLSWNNYLRILNYGASVLKIIGISDFFFFLININFYLYQIYKRNWKFWKQSNRNFLQETNKKTEDKKLVQR